MQSEVVHVLRQPVRQHRGRHLRPVVIDVARHLVPPVVHDLPCVGAHPRHRHANVLGNPVNASVVLRVRASGECECVVRCVLYVLFLCVVLCCMLCRVLCVVHCVLCNRDHVLHFRYCKVAFLPGPASAL